LKRLIHSNDFAKMCGLACSGRLSKAMFITKATKLTDTSRGPKFIEDRLGLEDIFNNTVVTMRLGIFERGVRVPVVIHLVVAGIVDHEVLLEKWALASSQSNLGYRERFVKKAREKYSIWDYFSKKRLKNGSTQGWALSTALSARYCHAASHSSTQDHLYENLELYFEWCTNCVN
jgi:hypothetical protein